MLNNVTKINQHQGIDEVLPTQPNVLKEPTCSNPYREQPVPTQYGNQNGQPQFIEKQPLDPICLLGFIFSFFNAIIGVILSTIGYKSYM